MKTTLPIALLCACLLSTPAFANGTASPARVRAGISASESRGLRSLDDQGLGALRAGVSADHASIQTSERSSLVAASARASDLGDLRGGDLTLSDHDIQLIVIVAVVVLILVII